MRIERWPSQANWMFSKQKCQKFMALFVYIPNVVYALRRRKLKMMKEEYIDSMALYTE